MDHQNILIQQFDTKDRYYDTKSYKYNTIQINIGIEDNQYINASPINIIKEKYFISTQGPKENIVEDFWTIVDGQKCRVIVMLFNLEELGRENCAKYWHKNMIKYTIKIEKEIYIIRNFTLINNQTKKEKKIVQIYFQGWPDHMYF